MPNTWNELARRENHGTEVVLEWTPDSDSEPVKVTVRSEDQDFSLYPLPSDALDCFYHPFAYFNAAMNGKTRPVAA